ncbi:hypothetical protein O59_002648 [Cellvibrio sp. BR]|jgi:hypothetical protein|uniref:hypothetical protein n=1 Tax=unclassified Cellvibrio TaxID=2624793 RepID=UPI00026016A6|nr:MULTISPECIES: hypothetical protein [unclassified Cellvibrio]EIK44924.1 hypothetical protein O59_002648 [Cellvibrio sp. BR]UUA74409.1 hypothetical protein NNX04_08200 [Cellvibrio sp. QJXJ]
MSEQAIKDLAREYTRRTLAQSATFHQLGVEDQKSLYLDVYRQNYQNLAHNTADYVQAKNLPVAMADPKAGDMINDKRHTNQRIDQAGDLAGGFIDEVDFPGFVKDLLKGVFDANLEVTLAQMESYQKLLKAATQSISKFINSIDDAASFGYLAENNSDEFGLAFSDEENEDGSRKLQLTDASGQPMDLGDNQVKAKIMDAKIQMAKEQRAMLRETILMGITRLVVEKGNVKASVLFDIKASEQVQKSDKAAIQDLKSSSNSVSASGGLIGSIFGGPKGGHTSSRRTSKISVSSAKSVASTELAAKVTGSVDITFKSDYFKLDNFATLYQNGADGGAQLGPGQQVVQPAPAAAPAAAPALAGR